MFRHLYNIDSVKAGIASIGAAMTGELTNILSISNLEAVNIAFQHAAWVVAILAGLVSIVNGSLRWFIKPSKKYEYEDEE